MDSMAGGDDPFRPFKPGEASEQSRVDDEGDVAESWMPTIPAPEEPPEAGRIKHYRYGTAAARWIYRGSDGRPLFAVARFNLPDGSKQPLPYTWGRRCWTTKSGAHKGARNALTGWHF